MQDLSLNPLGANPGSTRSSWPWIMLCLRSGLFLACQLLTAMAFWALDRGNPWQASAAWWPVSATLTNVICVLLLRHLAHREGMRWSQLIGADFRRGRLGQDLVALLGVLLLCGPVATIPIFGLAQLLFGSVQVAVEMFIRPLPVGIALVSLILWPITQSFGELPAYFGYGMPRLAARGMSPWRAVAVSAFWLGAQHVMLPFLPDIRFILWRLGMFIPFALLLGWAVYRRPRLLPYFMVIHALIDFPVALMVWQASTASP